MALPIPKYNEIIELLKKGATLEAQEKIMELREATLELQEENIELKKKIKEIEASLEIKKNIVWESPYYYLKKDEKKDGPFCQLCFDKEGQLIRLQGGKSGAWRCHSCRTSFHDDSYVPRQHRTPSGGKTWMGA